MTEEKVLAALSTVMDPDLHRDLVSLGMIKDLKVNGSKVAFSVELTTPACPLKAKIENDCRQALASLPGVEEIKINMTARTTAAKTDKEPVKGVKNIFAVSSGKGGVGKSTVAVNLALALQRSGAKVGLMDSDAYGPNIPIMLGSTAQPIIKGDMLIPPEVFGLKMMSVGLIAPGDTPVVWRGPMLHSLVQQFLRNVIWGELDYLVVDMPPGTGDAQLSLSHLAPLAGAVMVTTPQLVAQADVKRAIMMFRKVEVPVLGVLENMSYFLCPDNNKHYAIFGSGGGEVLAREYEIPFLGRIPIDPRIAESGDKGKPIVVALPDSPIAAEFMKAAELVAQQISIANANRPLPVLS
ncbi:MAG: Mrp/NBP35 family ATP-binding protein [Candidatus Omnitrophota bacterium]